MAGVGPSRINHEMRILMYSKKGHFTIHLNLGILRRFIRTSGRSSFVAVDLMQDSRHLFYHFGT
jgi:hypothetical protein